MKIKNLEELEHIQNLQSKSNRILMVDQEVNELVAGKSHFKLIELIHNESYVETTYVVSNNPENTSESLSDIMAEGDTYIFCINISNESVTVVGNAEDDYLGIDSWSLAIKEDVSTENSDFFINSLLSMKSFAAPFLSVSQEWLYHFRIEGEESIKSKSGLSANKRDTFNYYLEITDFLNDGGFHLSHDPSTNPFYVSSNDVNNNLISYDSEQRNGVQSATIICPQKTNLSVDYSYKLELRAQPKQTVVFDVDLDFQKCNDIKCTSLAAQGWRVIFFSPPHPDELSEDELKSYGIEDKYGRKYHTPVITIVEKGDWLENVSGNYSGKGS
ncbi:hypothetical protein [Methanococcoides burtonii]|nr:hypothetical protein [Methanococcoides burtonii]